MTFDTYQSIAEVAVTLTGFIGVVVVLKNQNQDFSRIGLTTIMSTSFVRSDVCVCSGTAQRVFQ